VPCSQYAKALMPVHGLVCVKRSFSGSAYKTWQTGTVSRQWDQHGWI